MAKYAIIVAGVVDTISYDPPRNWVPATFDDKGEVIEPGHYGSEIQAPWVSVPDTVFGGFTKQGNTWVAPAVLPPSSSDIDAERDRRIALGFNWNGKHYQSRQFDLDNIRSMGAAATAMIAQGQVDAGYRWFDPAQDFVWIAADNTLTPMSASDMIDFALTAAIWVKNNIFAASAIKATAGGIPADYAADARWPSANS